MPNTPLPVILDGGAAGFAAVTEADCRDLSTAIVNTGLTLGGICVNLGCVPSKRLLSMADTANGPRSNPVDAVEYNESEPDADWAAALDEMDGLVGRLRSTASTSSQTRRARRYSNGAIFREARSS